MEAKTVAVVGAGTMGNGIAQVIAASGIAVVITDVSDAALARGLAAIDKSLERLVSREKLSAGDKSAVSSAYEPPPGWRTSRTAMWSWKRPRKTST